MNYKGIRKKTLGVKTRFFIGKTKKFRKVKTGHGQEPNGPKPKWAAQGPHAQGVGSQGRPMGPSSPLLARSWHLIHPST